MAEFPLVKIEDYSRDLEDDSESISLEYIYIESDDDKANTVVENNQEDEHLDKDDEEMDEAQQPLRETGENSNDKDIEIRALRERIKFLEEQLASSAIEQGQAKSLLGDDNSNYDNADSTHSISDSSNDEASHSIQPTHLKTLLEPHQLRALKWMRERETKIPKGGILADDMGLGKSLTAIALVVDKLDQNERSFFKNDRNERLCYRKCGTLIVSPASMVVQWSLEIQKHVKQEKLKVLVYHGSNRNKNEKNLMEYDVVLTSYETLADVSIHQGFLST